MIKNPLKDIQITIHFDGKHVKINTAGVFETN